MKRIGLSLLLLLITATWAIGQAGLRSPKTKYRQIDSDTVRIIFTEEMAGTAQRVAGIIHRMAREQPINGSDKLRKISILLQNETDIPNGYVGLAPWVSEFYTSPPPNNFELGSLPWADLLAIHEFRHVQQRSSARIGLSAWAYYLMGEDFFSAIVNLSWPDWYTEGDAVASETALTNQGRGRLPAFYNAYREKIMGGEGWRYDKARNGSFKEFVPSHYHLGFLMQNYGRKMYGQDFWDQVALESAGYKGLIYPFSKAIERVTGVNSRNFYSSALEYYADQWELPEDDSPAQMIIAERKEYQDFSNPVFTEDGSLLCVVESFDKIPGIYRVESDGELSKILDLGFSIDNNISYAAGKLTWAELRLDSRWLREDYSSIVVFDMETKRRQTITHKQSYFAPTLAPNGNVLAAVHGADDGTFEVQILTSRDGQKQSVLPNPRNYYVSYPAWFPNGEELTFSLRDSSGNMALGRQRIDGGEIEILTQWTNRPTGRPYLHGDWIYFTKSEEITDQIYRVNVETKELQRVSNGVHSVYQPSINPTDGSLVFAQYSLQGKKLYRSTAEEIIASDIPVENNDFLAVESTEGDILDSEYDREFETKKYAQFANPVNIHSWRPIGDDPVYGIEIQSENVLQSIRWNTGFQFQRNEQAYGPYTNIVIGTWYPQIVFGYTGWKFRDVEDDIKFFRHTFNTGVQVPFKGLAGAFSYAGFISTSYNRSRWTGDLDLQLNDMRHRFSVVNRKRQAIQHPITRLGQSIELLYGHSVDAFPSTQFLVKTDFTFPSPLRNQVLWLQFDYKDNEDLAELTFIDEFNYSRGYQSVASDWIYRVGINYQLPLAYPDWGFAGIVYFKRIRANLFADISQYSFEGTTLSQNSVGGELIFDLELANIEPVTVGLRGSYLIDESGFKFGVFIPLERI